MCAWSGACALVQKVLEFFEAEDRGPIDTSRLYDGCSVMVRY